MKKKLSIQTGYPKPEQTNSKPGKVYLVGAGPGAAELLTVKALKVIESCDVILYDNLVSEEIKSLFPANISKLFVGKMKNLHSVAQQNLNQILVDYAMKGLKVCRLKGGDPFIFGRGSEEMLTLKENNIDVEIVPGITAASGCTSYAGIPLTHRGISQGCTFLTGHTERDPDFDWQAIAKLDHTLVFYMGLSKLEFISRNLVTQGMDADTPVALIENGSRPSQKVVSTKLSDLLNGNSNHQLKSPCLIVIGQTTELREQLQWFEGDSPVNNLQTEKLAPYSWKRTMSA
ncbi:MAG: uroporphyrinogen-III C-methyltransferase [Kangiellaceae bacterium]|nr:uroporphyrinogen-III C-methyltransferase [Kangiellaceae bacterium]